MTAPREPVGRDGDVKRLLELGPSHYEMLSLATLTLAARDERDALVAEVRLLRAAAREYLTFTSHVVGPRHVVDARMALEALAGEDEA
jgi:hypothetical protein